MFNCWMIIPRDTLYTPLFKSKILPNLWMQVSQDPVIGYAWSCPCLGALVLDFIGEKSLCRFSRWVPRYLRSKIGYDDFRVDVWYENRDTMRLVQIGQTGYNVEKDPDFMQIGFITEFEG
jgi:hypothetical protein